MKEKCLSPEEMGRRLQRSALAVAVALSAAFCIMYAVRLHASHALADEAAESTTPTVDVVVIGGKPADGSLTLPGETAAWYESTIYARVSGYVAKWNVDIGDHVAGGQLLASIDTPELDAELSAARAKLQVPRRKSG